MIHIKNSSIWYDSRKKLTRDLGEYHSSTNPSIILNFVQNHEGDEDKIVLNRNVELMRDKVKMNKLLDKLKIRHPKTYYRRHFLPRSKKECVVKERFGSRGCGIKFITFKEINKKLLNENKYIQDFVPFTHEYRVVVDFLGIIGMKEKIGDAKCKNSLTCEFKYFRHKYFLELFAQEVYHKIKAFGIDFTGMDIGEYKGNFYLIELNSAPGLCKAWSRRFANDLIGILYR